MFFKMELFHENLSFVASNIHSRTEIGGWEGVGSSMVRGAKRIGGGGGGPIVTMIYECMLW